MRSPYAALATLWAFGVLFHAEWPQPDPAYAVPWAVLLVLALVVVWRPEHPWTLPLLAVAQVCDVAFRLPRPTNHWLLQGMMAAALIAATTVEWRRGPRPDPEARLWARLERFAPAARLGTIIFYAFTGLWKLNEGYFDPEVGCGAQFFLEMAPDPAPRYAGLASAVSSGVVVYELLLPALLLWPRTRRVAVLSAVLFHFALSLDIPRTFLNFSSTMFPLLFLFAARPITEQLASERWSRGAKVLGVAFALLVATAALTDSVATYLLGRFGAFVLVALALGFGSWRALRDRDDYGPDPVRPRSLMWLLPLIVVLNGLTPIIGVKTTCAWQMYSNLKVTEASSNHYLLPASLDAFGYLADRVRVLEASDPVIARLAESEAEVPWVQLRRYAEDADSFRGRFEHVDGHVVEIADSRDSAQVEPLGWLERSFVFFFSIPDGQPECTW